MGLANRPQIRTLRSKYVLALNAGRKRMDALCGVISASNSVFEFGNQKCNPECRTAICHSMKREFNQ